MTGGKALRTQWMIYPNFQMAIVAVNSVFLMMLAMIVGFAAKSAFAKLNQIGVDIHLYRNHPFFLRVIQDTHHFYGVLVLTLISTLVLSNAVIIYFTHKIAGPIVHLENYLQNVVRRERAPRKPLRFREGDYFRDLPGSVNGAIRLLSAGVSEDTQTVPAFRPPRS